MYVLDHYKTRALLNNEIVLNNNIENDNNENSNNIFNLFRKLNSMFWVISLLILLNYGCLMPFNYMAVGFYTKYHNLSKNLAGILII